MSRGIYVARSSPPPSDTWRDGTSPTAFLVIDPDAAPHILCYCGSQELADRIASALQFERVTRELLSQVGRAVLS